METEGIPLTFERQRQAQTPITIATMSSSETSNTKTLKNEEKSTSSNTQNPQEVVLKEKLIHAFRLNRKKQLTLERINKYNQKLMEEVKTPRVKASNCALMVINYTEQTKDPLIPEIWGYPPVNPYKQSSSRNQTGHNAGAANNEISTRDQRSDSGGCCIIM